MIGWIFIRMNLDMSNWPEFRRLSLHIALGVVLGFTPLVCAIHGQATQSQHDQFATSIANAKSGAFGAVDIETIARAGAAEQVLPALEEQFTNTTESTKKGVIASALVRLGDGDNTYWNFLLEQATLAVDSDLPDPFHDSPANATGDEPSPKLSAWAQAHHVDYSTAAQSAVYGLPGKVMLLGKTGDPRAIPLLRRALQSQNSMIVAMAASGLAQVQDKGSIPLIIEACRRAPKGFDSGIAESSLIF